MRYLLLMNYAEPAPGDDPRGDHQGDPGGLRRLRSRAAGGRRARRRRGAHLPASTTTLTLRAGSLDVQDGPFAETKEALAGVFVVDVPDLDAALGWAEKCPGAQFGVMEVRAANTSLRRRRLDRALPPVTEPPRRRRHDAAPVVPRWCGPSSRPAPATAGCSPSSRPAPTTSPAPRTPSPTPSSGPCAPGRSTASPTAPTPGCSPSPATGSATAGDRPRPPAPPPSTPTAHAPVHLDDVDPDAVPDRRLELMLVCAHPAIAVSDRTPLMLNTVLGFTAEQVARSYAVPTRTMATRLVRAKRRIRDNRIPFRLPDRSQLPERMDAVLAAVYAAYVIEWSTGPGERDLPPEALHLAEVLAELAPDDPEVRGLAALVELSAARRPARFGADGRFVPLASQDTALWDADLIARAHDHLRAAHPARVVGRYQLEAAVQAVHCARRETGRTDWPTLLELHRSLAVVAPSLGSATALAAVTARGRGPGIRPGAARRGCRAHRRASSPPGRPAPSCSPGWVATAEAADAYDHAIALTHETPERRHLEARRAALRR